MQHVHAICNCLKTAADVSIQLYNGEKVSRVRQDMQVGLQKRTCRKYLKKAPNEQQESMEQIKIGKADINIAAP